MKQAPVVINIFLGILMIVICIPSFNDFPCQAAQPGFAKEIKSSSYEFDHSPAFEDSVPPAYPKIAQRAQIEGTVVIKAIVDADGQLIGVEVVRGVNPLLNKAAFEALKESTFTPATLRGKAVPGSLIVAYPFDLDLWYRENLRKESPPIDWSPPLISEVGELVEKRGNDGMTSCVFSYNDIRFYGDISVEIYERALEQVCPHLADGEVVLSINHHLAYKEIGQMDFMAICDLEFTTCTELNSTGDCSRGNIFTFVNKDGVYTLEFQKGVRRIWIH